MGFQTPTLQQAIDATRANMRAELPGTDANVWPNTNYVYAKILGGLKWELYQYIQWVSRQKFVTTADADQLDQHGSQFGLARNPATYAGGAVNITGTPAHTIGANTLMQTADGVVFRTLSAVTLDAGGAGEVEVEADLTGPQSNVAANTQLTLISADADVAGITVDEIGLGGGANAEGDESYRARILLRLRYPPHGGAAHDYVFWALKITGVTRVWVDATAYGPGTVAVWFMADDTFANGVPDATMVNSVAAYIESQRPVTARVTVAAPIAAATDITVKGVGTPSQEQQDQIAAELKDLFRRAVQVSTVSAPYTLSRNLLWQAVARATGSSAHTIQLPVADTLLPAGYIPTLGKICLLE